MKNAKIIAILFIGFFCILPLKAFVMSSASYQINWDSVNIGGADQSSASYKSQDTVGEVATGDSQSTSYKLQAGYQQMLESTISITADNSVAMLPALMAITGGTANGTGTATVITNDPAGYKLEIKASQTPALQSSASSFSDYVPASTPVPDYNWTIGSSNSRFGFTAWGTDVAQNYLAASNSCNQSGGSANGTYCWNGFDGANNRTVAQSAASNYPSGTVTSVKYQAQIKSNGFQTPGSYSAVITATATTN
jgi:hypothetical protein